MVAARSRTTSTRPMPDARGAIASREHIEPTAHHDVVVEWRHATRRRNGISGRDPSGQRRGSRRCIRSRDRHHHDGARRAVDRVGRQSRRICRNPLHATRQRRRRIIRFEYRLDGAATWTDTGSLADEFVLGDPRQLDHLQLRDARREIVGNGPASAPRPLGPHHSGAPVLTAIVPGDRNPLGRLHGPERQRSAARSPATSTPPMVAPPGAPGPAERLASPLVITTESDAGATPRPMQPSYPYSSEPTTLLGNGRRARPYWRHHAGRLPHRRLSALRQATERWNSRSRRVPTVAPRSPRSSTGSTESASGSTLNR